MAMTVTPLSNILGKFLCISPKAFFFFLCFFVLVVEKIFVDPIIIKTKSMERKGEKSGYLEILSSEHFDTPLHQKTVIFACGNPLFLSF